MKLSDLATRLGYTRTDGIGQAVEDMVASALSRRKSHERRWYDNNFFDDGYHFRSVSKKTGRVIDHTARNSGYVERAIPRASRQIRGVSNLLFAAEPYPVVYPKRVSIEQFRDETGEINQDAYDQAMENNKQIARKQGTWLSTEWEDEQELPSKLIDMILLAAKNSVSWLQVYSDTNKQKIITDVYDAFDVICYGDVRDENMLPFITKACPMDIKEVLTDSRFDEAKLKNLTPDNKYATSEVKNAYMNARYGNKGGEDNKNSTIIVKETFMKEALTEDNWKRAAKLGETTGAMDGKSKGDLIMRHVFSAGAVTLQDEYVDYDNYPLVPFRFEPGPLYQVPFIERFIPQNKSVDIIVTRLEKWVNAMVVGVYMQRKGENFQLSNFPGGQKIEYEQSKPEQMQAATTGNTPFNVLNMLDKYIDEQGATTAGGQNVPQGVKSGVAIESVKSTEYANLKIPTMMLKKTIKRIAERMLERAHKDYLVPKEVESIEDGEPDYFDVIGKRGFDLSQEIDKKLPEDIVVLDKDTKVRIEIEPGLGLTMMGKRDSMESIIEYMLKLTEAGYVTKEAMQMVLKRFLETFGFGSTQEFMEAMDDGTTKEDMTNEKIQEMKIAIVEAMRDSGAVGPEAEARLVDSTKVGVLETLKDVGLIDKAKNEESTQEKPPSKSISFKDLPPEGKAQLAAQAGIALNPEEIAADEQQEKQQDAIIKQKEMALKEETVKQKGKALQKKPTNGVTR